MVESEEDPLGPAGIRQASTRIHPAFLASPQFVHDGLSERAGRPVIVKIETVNPIRSFKGRGTWRIVHELAGEGARLGRPLGPGRPLVAASTGNFGQGLAFAGRAAGVPITVFADERANPLKLDRIRSMGATVVQTGHDFDAARAASERYVRDQGGQLVVDGEDPRVAGGAGTLALEVTDGIASGALPPLGAAYIPVGNGALIVGVGAWLRSTVPECLVIGLQSEAAPSMTLSWRAGRPIETESAATFAEGIATRVPVPEALDQMRGRGDDMRLIPEEAIRAAQRELTEALGILVEGSAAISWAGILADEAPLVGAALLLVTGSNVATA